MLSFLKPDKTLNYGRQQIVDLCTGSGNLTILDLGAGTGKDLNNLKQKFPQARTIGVECYPESCKELEKNGHEVLPVNVEVDRLPFEDNSVDIIVANQIMEHCKEIFWIFHEATRVLKPNGIFVVGVPNLASLHNRFLLLIGQQPTSIQLWSAHVRGVTAPGLKSFLENIYPNGFEIQAKLGANFYPFPPFLARPLAVLFPNLSVGLFFKLVKRKPYQKEFITYPVKERLETNFYLGKS